MKIHRCIVIHCPKSPPPFFHIYLSYIIHILMRLVSFSSVSSFRHWYRIKYLFSYVWNHCEGGGGWGDFTWTPCSFYSSVWQWIAIAKSFSLAKISFDNLSIISCTTSLNRLYLFLLFCHAGLNSEVLATRSESHCITDLWML